MGYNDQFYQADLPPGVSLFGGDPSQAPQVGMSMDPNDYDGASPGGGLMSPGGMMIPPHILSLLQSNPKLMALVQQNPNFLMALIQSPDLLGMPQGGMGGGLSGLGAGMGAMPAVHWMGGERPPSLHSLMPSGMGHSGDGMGVSGLGMSGNFSNRIRHTRPPRSPKSAPSFPKHAISHLGSLK